MSDRIIILYAARHGTTTLNTAGAFRGSVDVPLDTKGIKDAHQLAFYFEPIEVCHIVSSDKKRAAKTAEIIGSRKHIQPLLTDSIHPLDVGDFSGKPKNEENRAALEHYINHPELTIPGGEALNDFKARVRPAIQEAMEIADNSGQPILLVVHSSIIHEIGSMINGHHGSTLVEPGGVAAIYMENGVLKAEPIFKPISDTLTGKADTIS